MKSHELQKAKTRTRDKIPTSAQKHQVLLKREEWGHKILTARDRSLR